MEGLVWRHWNYSYLSNPARISEVEQRGAILSSGTMTFGEGNSYQDACAQLDMAHEAGVNFIDSAEM